MNPFAWMVDLTRSAVYGSELPEGLEDIMLSVPQALGYLSVLVVICGLVSLRQVGGRHG
jgi:hypothetical protein